MFKIKYSFILKIQVLFLNINIIKKFSFFKKFGVTGFTKI